MRFNRQKYEKELLDILLLANWHDTVWTLHDWIESLPDEVFVRMWCNDLVKQTAYTNFPEHDE